MDMPPIVEKMYELNKWLLHKVGKFPRDQRLLGERLIRKSLDIQEQWPDYGPTAEARR